MIMVSMLLLSCERQPISPDKDLGLIELSFNEIALRESNGRIASGLPSSLAILLSVDRADGTPVFERYEVPLLKMGKNYISRPIQMITGDYILKEYLVVNESKEVLLATPLRNSPLAYLVKSPLPFEFKVKKGKALKLIPEVISTEKRKPEAFGYINVTFDEVGTFDFLLSVFVYDRHDNSMNLTDGNINIMSEGDVLYDSTFVAGVNQITLPDGYENYTININKDNYVPYSQEVANDSLKLYFSSADQGPLEIILDDGLVLWNKLGSEEEVLHSEYGPDLAFGDGIQKFVDGKFGGAIGIKKGNYHVSQRNRNVIFDNLKDYINTEAGTIEFYVKVNDVPVAFDYNPYRFFDGPFGLRSGVALFYYQNDDFDPAYLAFAVFFDNQPAEQVMYHDFDKDGYLGKWVHIAGVWDRNGIQDSDETLRLYINGQQIASSKGHNWGTEEKYAADIASGNDHIGDRFYMDNLKVYSIARTEFSITHE